MIQYTIGFRLPSGHPSSVHQAKQSPDLRQIPFSPFPFKPSALRTGLWTPVPTGVYWNNESWTGKTSNAPVPSSYNSNKITWEIRFEFPYSKEETEHPALWDTSHLPVEVLWSQLLARHLGVEIAPLLLSFHPVTDPNPFRRQIWVTLEALHLVLSKLMLRPRRILGQWANTGKEQKHLKTWASSGLHSQEVEVLGSSILEWANKLYFIFRCLWVQHGSQLKDT